MTVGLPPETRKTAPVPPVRVPPCIFKVPLAVVRLTHESASPVLSALTEVSVMLSGELFTLTARASVVEIVPLVEVVVPVLLARTNAATVGSGAISRSAKVTAPAFVPRFTPAPAEVLDVVLPKFIVPPAPVFVTEMPMPVGFVVVVVPTVMLPLTRSRLTPCVPLLVEDSVVKFNAIGVAGAPAFVMLSAGPSVVVMLPVLLVTVIDPVFSVPTRPLPFVFVPPSERKLTLPALLAKFTREPGEALVTAVLPNETEVLTPRLCMSMPCPVPATPEMLVVPATVLPPPAPLRKAELAGPLMF